MRVRAEGAEGAPQVALCVDEEVGARDDALTLDEPVKHFGIVIAAAAELHVPRLVPAGTALHQHEEAGAAVEHRGPGVGLGDGEWIRGCALGVQWRKDGEGGERGQRDDSGWASHAAILYPEL